ncbi:MAG: 4-alpha-glucanotransferase [Chitinispirillaceae bacterium]|nr:4-alpha-glucanotransferase [Chitinispirillaceae bacterium]
MFPRGSGVLLHISSLPSVYGIGDLGPEAYAFVDLLHEASQTYWQVLPLNPTQRSNFNSPYFSSSSAAGNELLISPERLMEAGLLKRTDIPSRGFPENEVDFPAVTAYKRQLLEAAYRRRGGRREREGFISFCDAEKKWLDDFALFMACKKRFRGVPWNRWPEPVKFRRPAELEKMGKRCRKEIERQKWYQYIFSEQWTALRRYCNERSIRIVGDLPIYVSYDSVDVWANPALFKLDGNLDPVAVSGVPPDYFSATGQLWNNPVYNWDNLRADGFSWWSDRMKTMLDRFDIVRIDHIRGLVQYWEVPAGATTAINGSWRPVPAYELFDSLKARFPDLPVIAEDLGTITDDVREAINRYGFPGMKILLFAFGDDNPDHPYLPHRYEQNCFVYTGTHDNNTVRGWFEQEAGEKERERFFRYTGIAGRSAESVVKEMVRLAQKSAAAGAIIPAQDLLLLGAETRMNRPAVEEGNWKWRLTREQMRNMPAARLADMAKQYGRAPMRGVSSPDHSSGAKGGI